MESEGSDKVHHKYSKEELLTISKLELSLKKPDVLRDECFNENKKWSPELGFKAMLLESRHANGNSTIKLDLKNDVDATLPPLRPQLGGWGSGCIGMKPSQPVTQTSNVPQPKDTSPVRPVNRPAKIIIPPRPQEDRHQQEPLGHSWRDKGRFELEKGRRFEERHDGSRRPAWNEKPVVGNKRDDGFNNRYDRYEPRYPPKRNGHHYQDEDMFDDEKDPWDDPDDFDTPFDLVGLPGDMRSEGENQKSAAEPASKSVSPPAERPPSQTNIPRSDSPDMESRMMSELLKIFDDSEVTEIPVVTNPGGSRILGLISQQDHHFQPPTSSYEQQMDRRPQQYSDYGDQHQYMNRSDNRGPVAFHGNQQQQQSDGGAVANDLLQILQKAKINVNNLVPSNTSGGVPSLNVAQAKSLAEIEGGMSSRALVGGYGRSSPQSEPQPQPGSENHAFNKLLEMMNSSRTRTENHHQQQQQGQQQQQQQFYQSQPRVSSYELERMHEEKKRMEQQQQISQEIRRDSVGSSGSPFVPIQVMRQARGHFQEQLPRPVVGRTSSSGPGIPHSAQPGPFGPRMGLSEAEMRHLAQFRHPVASGPQAGLGRNSPVNLLQQSQQQFMIPHQIRGGAFSRPPWPVPGGIGLRPSQQPVGAPGQPRGAMPGQQQMYQQQQQFQSRAPGPQQQPQASQSQGPMNLQQLQMLNQHLHSLPPHQLSEMSRGMTSEQLNQMLLRASHQ